MSEDLIRQVDEMFRSLMAEIGWGTSHKLRMERAMIKFKPKSPKSPKPPKPKKKK